MNDHEPAQSISDVLTEIDPIIHAPARLLILAQLYVVERADFVFLKRMTRLTWGNLSTHLSKLESADYVQIEKGYLGKKPQTMIQLTEQGRAAFRDYKQSPQGFLNDLPD